MMNLATILCLALLGAPSAPTEAPTRGPGRVDPHGNRVERRAQSVARPDRRHRESIEAAPAPTPEELELREQLLEIPALAGGCSIRRQPRLVERLLGLENATQALNIEIWGDLRAYEDRQKVLFYMRAPLRMYVTLFWIGPGGEIFVPFDNIAIPANRNTMVDPDAVIVPPLGHERWVAIATLEPVRLPCGAAESVMLGVVDQAVALPHAIGRWEVWSGDEPPGR
jgi:hypothetical protein